MEKPVEDNSPSSSIQDDSFRQSRVARKRDRSEIATGQESASEGKTARHTEDSSSDEGDRKPEAEPAPTEGPQAPIEGQVQLEDSLRVLRGPEQQAASAITANVGLSQSSIANLNTVFPSHSSSAIASATANEALLARFRAAAGGLPQHGLPPNLTAATVPSSQHPATLQLLANRLSGSAQAPRDLVGTSALATLMLQQGGASGVDYYRDPSSLQSFMSSTSHTAPPSYRNLAPFSFSGNSDVRPQLSQLFGQRAPPRNISEALMPHAPTNLYLNYHAIMQSNLIEQQINETRQRDILMASQTGSVPTAASTIASSSDPNANTAQLQHYSHSRPQMTLGIDEDQNWLSEFQCFIRSELIEVIQGSHQDAAARAASKAVSVNQAGIRCRFCAHLQPGQRASRATAFPSSLRQLYQSFTMMQRDHFANCDVIPSDLKQRYMELQNQQRQGATDSKHYWIYSAQRIGMVNSEHGILITEESKAAARNLPSFGTSEDGEDPAQVVPSEPIVPVSMEEDLAETTPFVFAVLSQLQLIYLLSSERVGKRKTLPLRLEGFGCRYCCQVGRLGFSRSFPLRRRALPYKVEDMFHHLRRCTLCPVDVKQLLIRLNKDHEMDNQKFTIEQEKAFYDKLWRRLGRDADITT